MIAGLEELQEAVSRMIGGEDREPEPINRDSIGYLMVVVEQISSYVSCMPLPRLSAEQWSMLLAWQLQGQSRVVETHHHSAIAVMIDEVLSSIVLHLMATYHQLHLLQEPDALMLEPHDLRDRYRDIEARLIIAIVWLRLLDKPHEIRFCTPAALILDNPEEQMACAA